MNETNTSRSPKQRRSSLRRGNLFLLWISLAAGFFGYQQILLLRDYALRMGPNIEHSISPPEETNERRGIHVTSFRTLPLTELAGSSIRNLDCPPPLVPFYDKVLDEAKSENGTIRNIPRIVHVSMKSRCLPQDLAKSMDLWQEALPNYSIFFHDDDAVDRLIEQDWPEFPHLQLALNCVKFKGAMKIDVWRILVLYRYGGIYTDIDNWPTSKFHEDIIEPEYSAFFFSDDWGRPSQWFMAMEPRHPIAYFAMLEILNRLVSLNHLAKPDVVFVTGPDIIKHAYWRFLNWQEGVFKTGGTYRGMYSKVVRKIGSGKKSSDAYIKGNFGGTGQEMVAWNATVSVTRQERAELESGVIHWSKVIRHKKARRRKKAAFDHPNECMGYLYTLERERGTSKA